MTAASRPANGTALPPDEYPLTLAYHRICRRPLLAGTWVHPAQLAAQLDALARAGARFTGADEVFAGATDPGDARVMVTFDDGTADVHEHREVLQRRGIRPVVFVPADRVGRTNDWEWPIPGRRTRHLDRNQLRELVALGWEIGLHGASHRALVGCDESELADELAGGRRRLAEACGRPVRWLSYPYGLVDGRVERAAGAAGLEAGFVMSAVSASSPAPSRWGLPRRPVYCIDAPGDVVAKWRDRTGAGAMGRWQLRKEAGAHAVGRWFAGRR